MPPAYVKPYVRRGKTDAGDAEAIAEAVRRPTMRFVAIKSAEQQSVLALHRTRDLLVGQRTQLVNMIRSQLAEYGIVLAKGIHHALRLVDQLVEGVVPDIPSLACKIVIVLAEQIRELQARFSIFHSAAVALVRGRAGIEEYTDEAVNDPAVVTLRGRMTANVEPGIEQDQTDITITLEDGRVLTQFIEHAIGSKDNPMTDTDTKTKLQCVPILGEAGGERMIAMCRDTLDLDSAAAIAESATP